MKIGLIEGAQEDKRYDKYFVETGFCKKNKPIHEKWKFEKIMKT
jgi:hypothetical protein